MGFFRKMASTATSKALGDQGVEDQENAAYARERGWTYVHSELGQLQNAVDNSSDFISFIKAAGGTVPVKKDGEYVKDENGKYVLETAEESEVVALPRTKTYPFQYVPGKNVPSRDRGTSSGREIFLGEYNDKKFAAGTFYWKIQVENAPDTEYRAGIISLDVNSGLNLPPIQLLPETLGSRAWGRVFGDINVESHEFNQAWNVDSRKENRNAVITLLHPQMQEYLMSLLPHGVRVGFDGSRVVIGTRPYRINKSGVQFHDGGVSVGKEKVWDMSATVVDDYMLQKEEIEGWLAVAEGIGSYIPAILRDYSPSDYSYPEDVSAETSSPPTSYSPEPATGYVDDVSDINIANFDPSDFMTVSAPQDSLAAPEVSRKENIPTDEMFTPPAEEATITENVTATENNLPSDETFFTDSAIEDAGGSFWLSDSINEEPITAKDDTLYAVEQEETFVEDVSETNFAIDEPIAEIEEVYVPTQKVEKVKEPKPYYSRLSPQRVPPPLP